jgi:hypothetical protein
LQAATEALRQANISGKRQLEVHTDSKFLQDSATKVNSLFILISVGIRICMFLGLPDPDLLVRGMDPDPALDPSLFS